MGAGAAAVVGAEQEQGRHSSLSRSTRTGRVIVATTPRHPSPDSDDEAVAAKAKDSWGRSPLHWAVVNGHRTVVMKLLEAGPPRV